MLLKAVYSSFIVSLMDSLQGMEDLRLAFTAIERRVFNSRRSDVMSLSFVA